MKYIITTEVFDKDDKSIEKNNIIQDSNGFLTVGQLKNFGGKSKYSNIDTDDFMHHGQNQPDNEMVKLPFIYYKIKLK